MPTLSSLLALTDHDCAELPPERRRDYLLGQLADLEAREARTGVRFRGEKAAIQERICVEARAWIARHESAPSFAHAERAW